MGTRVRGARLRGDRGKGGLRSEEDVEGSANRLGGYRRAGAGTSSSNTHACASVSPAVSSCVPTSTAPNAPPHAARASLSPATSPSCEWGRGDECAPHAQGISVERERWGKRKMHGLQDGSGTMECLERNKRADLKQRLAPCSHWVNALRCRSATGWNMGERAEHWAMFLWG